MSIKKHPTKGPGWWQIYISHGRNKKQTVHVYQGTEAEAIDIESQLRGIPKEVCNQKPTDVIGRFLDWYAIHRSANSMIYVEAALPKIIKRLGDKNLSIYRQVDYTRYKQQRAEDGVTKRTVNIELYTWRSMFRFANEQLQINVGDLPQLYPRKQTKPPDKQPLTAEETSRLMDALSGDKKTIAMLYAYCGLRRDEALTLTRAQVDLDRKLLHIRGKGDKPRLVPIVSDALQQQLKNACRGKQRTDILFVSSKSPEDKPQPYKNIKKALKGAAKRAGIEKPVYNHLLRHSAATNAVVAGVNIRALQTILGHSDIRTTELYTHMAAEIITSEAQKMAGLHNTATSNNNIMKNMSEMSETKKQKNSNVIQLVRKSTR